MTAAGNVDGGEEIAGEFVVSGGDGAVLFEFVEEPLDEVAFAIEDEVARARGLAAGLGRDDWGDSPSGEELDEWIGIVGLVGEHASGSTSSIRWLGLAEILSLARREQKLDRVAERIDQGVDFGGQSAAGSADGLRAVFFRAPALC